MTVRSSIEQAAKSVFGGLAPNAELSGDILLIHDNGAGFLSATGRGGDRVLYALTAHDVRFYLETQDLVTGRVALLKTA